MFKTKILFFSILLSLVYINIYSYEINPIIQYTNDIYYLDLFKEFNFFKIHKKLKEEGTPNVIFEEFNLSILHYAITINSEIINRHMEESYSSTTINLNNFQTFILLLIINGADYTIHNNINGYTAIHEAVYRNNKWAMEIFCKHCNLNILDKEGNTPLDLAIKLGNYKLTKMLLNSGANYKIKNSKGKNGLELARELSSQNYKLYSFISDYNADNSSFFEVFCNIF